MNNQVINIMQQLHTPIGFPRLEIEGAGKPSVESLFLDWLQEKEYKDGKSAVYVIRDWYENTSYVTTYQTECILFERSELERLIESTLNSESKQADSHITAKHIVHDESHEDYIGCHQGSPPHYEDIILKLSLNLLPETPHLSIEYKKEYHKPAAL